MAYKGTIIQVMIASPADVAEEREIARMAIHDWNYIHTAKSKVALIPIGWETHSTPDLGGRAQEIINLRLLKDSDLVVAIFWTRLGTPTGDAASGTAEEITKHHEAGKPVMVYFSSKPVVLDSVDPDQYKELKKFRAWCESKGLIETFNSPEDFRLKLQRQLQISLNSTPYLREIMDGVAAIEDSLSIRKVMLSDDATELLLGAADEGNGEILLLDYATGFQISTGQRQFITSASAREAARWRAALEELMNYGLVQGGGFEGVVFTVTHSGYGAVDQIKGMTT